HARLLAAGEAPDAAIELAGIEEEALGPAGDVDGTVAEGDGVAVCAEGFPQRVGEVELFTSLIEVDGAEGGGALDCAGIGLKLAVEYAEQRGLAGTVEAVQAEARAGTEREGEVAKQGVAAEFLCELIGVQQALGGAAGGGEIDLGDAALLARF